MGPPKPYENTIRIENIIGERNLKNEISSRTFDNPYEIKKLLGINVKVMVQDDLGELMEVSMKKFVQKEMRSETINLLKFYKEFPIT